MTTKAAINDFLAQQKIAVVGVSRNSKKFGNIVYKDLRKKGYQTFAINPSATTVDGEPCYPDLHSLPQPVDAMVVVVPPAETEKIVRQAAEVGIRHVWMQQGAESEQAIRLCKENNINVIHGQCILMFSEPTGFMHRLHRWVWSVLGKLPN